MIGLKRLDPEVSIDIPGICRQRWWLKLLPNDKTYCCSVSNDNLVLLTKLIMQIGHHKEFLKLFLALALDWTDKGNVGWC